MAVCAEGVAVQVCQAEVVDRPTVAVAASASVEGAVAGEGRAPGWRRDRTGWAAAPVEGGPGDCAPDRAEESTSEESPGEVQERHGSCWE